MRCKTCDYPLWNLKARQCPECGSPFVPTDFQFTTNSVQFKCPHCEQPYYGTDAEGRLSPIQFACVRCEKHIHMDEMVLLPTDGVEEKRTRAAVMPWLERRSVGRVRAWFATMGMAHTQSVQLMRVTPAESSMGQAWGFTAVTALIYAIPSVIPIVAFATFMIYTIVGSPSGGLPSLVGWSLLIAVGVTIGVVVGTLLLCLLYGALAHALLLMAGGRHPMHGIGRTYQAFCYSYGANSLQAIPCVGLYVGVLGWAWWVVSATWMVKEAQQVSGAQAAFAVVTPMATSLVIVVLWIIVTYP